MIRHILGKDLRLLWPMAVLVGGVQWLNAALLIGGGRFARSAIGQMSEFGWVSNNLLPGIALLGLVVLVVAVIQQDRLPGTTQDWLTRPIPRGQLLAAKLLFVVLSGLLPILIADVAMGLAEQLNTAEVMLASLTRSVVLLCLVCLPAALIGAVTRTLTEALVLVVIVVVLLIVEFIVLAEIGEPMPMMQSGYGWIVAPILGLLNLGALIVLLPLQLRWRSTNRVRWLVAAFFCLLPLIAFIPWGAAFLIDRAFESHTVSPVSITLDTNRRITFTPTGSYAGRPGKPVSVVLKIPVVLSNLGPGNRLNLDRIKLHSAGLLGRELERPFGYLSDPSSDGGKPAAQIMLTFPFEAFNAARAARSQIEVQLLATKLRLTAEKPVHDLRSIDDHGRCYRQDIVRGGNRTGMIDCVSTRPIGSCFRITEPAHQVPNAALTALRCGAASYAPWPLPLWRDAYYTVSLGLADNLQRPKQSDSMIANYIPDVHLVRAFDFAIAAAIETTGAKSADGAGVAARFASPAAVVVDRRGNLFIVDEADSVIRKVTPAGEVGTLAGMAQQTGHNDGTGAQARFTNPRGIAIDAADNLYVADSGSGLIRRITPAGSVSTMMGIAGGDGNRMVPLRFKNPRGVVCAPDGTVYVLDSNANGEPLVRKVAPGGAVNTVAGPQQPVGVPGNQGIMQVLPPESVEQD